MISRKLHLEVEAVLHLGVNVAVGRLGIVVAELLLSVKAGFHLGAVFYSF